MEGVGARDWPPLAAGGQVWRYSHWLDRHLYNYSPDRNALDARDVALWCATVKCKPLDDKNRQAVMETLTKTTARAVYGSNMMSRAGLGWAITVDLCWKVFARTADDDAPHAVTERDESHRLVLEYIYRRQPELEGLAVGDALLRAHNQVVQHAKAYRHMIKAFVFGRQDLTRELIRDTHRVLTKGVPIIEGGREVVQPDAYGGVYRTYNVGAGSTDWNTPHFVPARLTQICTSFKSDVASLSEWHYGDVFTLAVRYALRFAQIHPFQDGNARMSRIILNAILCRYGGVTVPIGENPAERDEYFGIMHRVIDGKRHHDEFQRFVLLKAAPLVREMQEKVAPKIGWVDNCTLRGVGALKTGDSP